MIKRLIYILGVLLLGSPASAYSPDMGFELPLVGTSFSSVTQNLPLVNDYVFGSSVVAGAGQTAITNSTQLGTYFNPYLDVTGTNTVNGEMERYQPFSASANFVFNSNNLQLTATLASGNVAPTAYGNLGNITSLSTGSFTAGTIGLSSVTNVSVGQIFVPTYFGEYVVTGLSGSGGSAIITTSPLMGSPSTITTGGNPLNTPFEFLPDYYATTSAPSIAGSSTLTFSAVPAGAASGQFVGFYNNTGNTNGTNNTVNASQAYTVTGTTGTTVTISPPLATADAVASGQGIFFSQPIRSGQIWTKHYYNAPSQNGARYLAVELTAQLPQNATLYNGAGSVSGAASNGQYGAWAAFWLYGGAGSGFSDASEVDVEEGYDNIVRNMATLDVTVHTAGPISSLVGYLYNPNLWSSSGPVYTYASGTDFSTTVHKFQMFWTPDMVYTFIDGQMIKAATYHWTASRDPQLGVNLAVGSFLNGLLTNNLVPVANTNFPETFNIYEEKVWAK